MTLALLVEWVACYAGRPEFDVAQWWADGTGALFEWRSFNPRHAVGRNNTYIDLDTPTLVGVHWWEGSECAGAARPAPAAPSNGEVAGCA